MKKIVRIAFIAVVTAVVGYGVYTSQGEEIGMSEVMLANVEALASKEIPNPMCLNGCLSDGEGCLCHYWFPTYRENR